MTSKHSGFRNDAKILSIIQAKEFKECSLVFLRLRELLMKYHKLKRRIQKIQQWNNEVPINSFNEYISECRQEMERIEDEVHKIAVETLPIYSNVLQFIGVDKSIDVVELLTIVDFNKGFEKLRRYTGHFSIPKTTRSGRAYTVKPRRYNHKARMCLQNIAEYLTGVEIAHQRYRRHIDGRLCRVYKEKRSKKALLRIQTELLKYLRRLVRTQIQATGPNNPGEKPRRPGKPLKVYCLSR